MKQLLLQSLFLSLFTILLANYGFSQTGPAEYMEVNTIVVMEAENLAEANAWIIDNDSPDHSGSGFIYWPNSGTMNNPGSGLIEVRIQINTPGTYLFEWRTQVGMGNSNTDHNDSWLRFPDASAFYAAKGNGSIVYPHDSGQFPNPQGAGADGWFKVYRYGGQDWTWNTGTNDHDAHDIHVEFDAPGVYTMQISGRSTYHFIDRIVLYQEDYPDPFDLDLPETLAGGTTSLSEPNTNEHVLNVYPNPIDLGAGALLNLSGLEPGNYNLQVFDFLGRQVFFESTAFSSDLATVSIPALPTSMYLIRLEHEASRKRYTARIQVK